MGVPSFERRRGNQLCVELAKSRVDVTPPLPCSLISGNFLNKHFACANQRKHAGLPKV